MRHLKALLNANAGTHKPFWVVSGHDFSRAERYAGKVRALAVVCQEVVDIETGSADGGFLVESSVRSMPVVLVDPRSQMAKPFGGVLVETGVGPLANGSLDEAFGLAIGARSVNASAGVSEMQIATGLCKEGGAEARTVVGHDATDLDAQVGEVGHGLAEEVAGGGSFFIGQQGGEGDAGVVVDGDIKKLQIGRAGFILGIAGDAMAGLVDTSQLLNVDVQQVAGSGKFVADDGHGGLQHSDLVQLEPGKDAAHGGPAQAGGLGDANPGPTLASQPLHAIDQFWGSGAGRSMRARAAIAQAGLLLGAEATHPLGRTLPAELELGRGLLQAQSALDHGFGKFLSTINRKSSMMVIVHSVSSVAIASQHQLPSSWPNGQQPIETSPLEQVLGGCIRVEHRFSGAYERCV